MGIVVGTNNKYTSTNAATSHQLTHSVTAGEIVVVFVALDHVAISTFATSSGTVTLRDSNGDRIYLYEISGASGSITITVTPASATNCHISATNLLNAEYNASGDANATATTLTISTTSALSNLVLSFATGLDGITAPSNVTEVSS